MKVERLYLEVTRKCDLLCEHCLRGERENIDMPLSTIDSIFNGIEEIDFLLLSGGEPLMAYSSIKRIVENIKARNIKVNKTLIITNGTVLNARIIMLLEELNNLTNLHISVSKDIFHEIAISNLKLNDLRDDHVKEMKKRFSTGFDISANKVLIKKRGRAANLTQDRLKELSSMSSISYDFSSEGMLNNNSPYIEINKDSVTGIIVVDVHGNIVSYSQSFKEEDLEANMVGANVNTGIYDAVSTYINTKSKGGKVYYYR